MLIITRRVGETIMIGEEISVTVLGVKGNQVRIGVNAPKSVPVHREEIFDRIKRGELPPPPAPGEAVGVAHDIVETTREGFAGEADSARKFVQGRPRFVDAQGREVAPPAGRGAFVAGARVRVSR